MGGSPTFEFVKFTVLVVLIAAEGPRPCVLKNSGEHPYLIGISWTAESEIEKLVAHGSLIRNDKVLSTCVLFERGDLLGELVHLIGQNSVDECLQSRIASQVEYHPNCDPTESLVENDFALWTPSEAFVVEGTPYLWGATSSQSSWPIVDAIRKLKHGEGALRVPLLVNNPNTVLHLPNTSLEHPWLTQEATLTYVPWVKCLYSSRVVYAINSSKVSHGNIGNYSFFCGHSAGFTANDSQTTMTRNWYTGAAIIAIFNDSSVPVGLVSRRIDRDFYLAVQFTWESLVFFRFATNNRRAPEPSMTDWCKISDKDQYPFLMRIIWFNRGIPETVGHGSLVREDKILTSCTRYPNLPVDLRDDPNWQIRGYNNRMGCSTYRQPSKIIKHPACSAQSAEKVFVHDFAVWSPTRDFSVQGTPYLFHPNDLPEVMMVQVRSILKRLNVKTGEGVMEVFVSQTTKNEASFHQEKSIVYISVDDCEDFLNLSRVNPGLNTAEEHLYSVMCGWHMFSPEQGCNNNSTPHPIQMDWYSGAPVIFRNDAARKIPIGINTRTLRCQKVEGNIYIFSSFDDEFFHFLLRNFAGHKPEDELEMPYSTRWPMSFGQRVEGCPKIVHAVVICLLWGLS